jgi:hypothetical protein
MHAWLLAVMTASLGCGRVGFSTPGDASADATADGDLGVCATATFDNPGTSTLVDEFAGTLDENWRVVTPCVSSFAGNLIAAPDMPGAYCHAWSRGDLHFTCDSIAVRVAEVTTAAVGLQTYIYVRPLGGGPSLVVSLEAGGMQLEGASTAFDPVRDAWWRLRELGGEVVLDTSPDGTSWELRLRKPTPNLALDHVEIAIGAGMWQTVANPGKARFRCLNAGPPCS